MSSKQKNCCLHTYYIIYYIGIYKIITHTNISSMLEQLMGYLLITQAHWKLSGPVRQESACPRTQMSGMTKITK